MLRTFLWFCFSFPFLLSAQFISSGPVVGGVHAQSARIYIRTTFLQNFTLEVDRDPNFSNPLQFADSTRADRYNSTITSVNGLDPSTDYYYRYRFGNTIDSLGGHFRTFPPNGQPAYTKLVVGSCNYGGYNNDILFGSIQNFDPDLFLHLGDWGFAPSTYGWDYNLFPNKVADAFSLRYADNNMARYVLPFTAVDYMYDDDYSQNDCEGWSYPTINTIPIGGGNFRYDLITNPMPAGIRTGAIKGYFDYFPGYAAVDTSAGVHHSFTIGNAEVFVVDTRLSKSARHDAFQQAGNLWAFQPGPNHSTLGASQRAWLVQSLKNSTADWKIVASSVVFNPKNRTLLDFMILGQLNDPATITYASELAYMWAGYPADVDTLLTAIDQHQIENVILLSGDTHSSMMDDGSNSRIPELSSSGLAAGGEGILNWTIDSIANSLGTPFNVADSLWNGGGNGISNQNFNDTYSTMEIFGRDSIRWCIFDELDQTIACMTLPHSSLSTHRSPHVTFPAMPIRLVYPNPAKDALRLQFSEDWQVLPDDVGQILDLQGHLRISLTAAQLRAPAISLTGLPEGTYLFSYLREGKIFSRKFVKH